MKFRELYMNGKIEFDEIFDYTEKWNFSDETCTLREYLGLTAEEEDVWISDSDEALEELLEKEKGMKALFLDLDGTLLDDNKNFTERNRRAIEKALSLGHKIIVCTGRPLVSAKAVSKMLGFDKKDCYVVAYNGGEIYDMYNHETIFKQTIPLEYVRYVFDASRAAGLHCQTYTEDGILAEQEAEIMKRYKRFTKVDYTVVDDVIAALPDEPVKMIVMDDDHEKLVEFREATKEWAEGKLDRIFSSPQYLEHVAVGISKGSSMERLCEKIGIPMANTIACGDEQNDISMIEAAGIGVAMKNAREEVKGHADYVTERDNNHDGIAEVIEKFMLK